MVPTMPRIIQRTSTPGTRARESTPRTAPPSPPPRCRRGGRINIAPSFFQLRRVTAKMSAPASLNAKTIPPDRINLSPASRNTVISGASGRTFMGTRAVRQRVALADTVIPGFTPRMPAIVEEVENPAVELTYPDGDTFGVADADGQVYVRPLHAKRLAVHFCGWVSALPHAPIMWRRSRADSLYFTTGQMLHAPRRREMDHRGRHRPPPRVPRRVLETRAGPTEGQGNRAERAAAVSSAVL